MTTAQIVGILPAVVFPGATALQLLRVLRTKSVAGVSPVAWTFFGIANIAMYIYAERYAEWQAIVGLLLTAVLDFAIAVLAITGFPSKPALEQESEKSKSAAEAAARRA